MHIHLINYTIFGGVVNSHFLQLGAFLRSPLGYGPLCRFGTVFVRAVALPCRCAIVGSMKASRIVVVLVCLCVCALFTVLYVRHYVVQPLNQPATAGVTNDIATGTTATVVPEVTPTYSTLPRFAAQVQQFVCNVTGTRGEESIIDYYAFGGYVYVLLYTDTDGDDYRAQGRSLAVARFDADCTLRDTLTLPRSAGYTYMCASLGDYGLLIAAMGQTDMRVWSVSVNLVAKTQEYPYTATDARMVYGREGNVLCFTGDKLYAMCLSPSLNVLWLHSASLDAMRLVDVYITASTYTVVCTSATQGAAYTLSAHGFVMRTSLVAIDAITPYAGGYAVVNNVMSSLYLYDISFGLVKTVSSIGGGYAAIASFANGLVLLAGDARGYTGILLCNHGDALCTFTLPEGSFMGQPQLVDDGALLFSMQDGSAWQLYRYVPFDSVPTLVCRVQGALDVHYWVAGGYLYCVCDSLFDYGCFQSCIGGRDVYILRTAYGTN